MNPGFRISGFIEDYTGITNAMLSDVAPCNEVMTRFASFIGDSNLLAHNASFDKRFLDAELKEVSHCYNGQFTCSLLLARRVFQHAPNHKLGTLINYKNIPSDGQFHRALYDSEMTAKLWLTLLEELSDRVGVQTIPFTLVQKICKTPKKSVDSMLRQWTAKQSVEASYAG